MTDKEKQIEKMAKDLKPFITLNRTVFIGATETKNVGWTLSEEDNKVIAEVLVKQGYRKIPEGSVVLSKEEYEKLSSSIKTEDEVRQIAKETIQRMINGIRKETAREIFAKEREFIYSKWKSSITMNDLIELAKQFGVEIKG